MTPRPATVLALVRGGHGTLLLTRPQLIANALLGRRLDPGEAAVARVLGARQIGQALVCAVRPATLTLGVVVDVLHAASMVAAGLADRPHRRAAFASAAVATSFAVAGIVIIRRAHDNDPTGTDPTGTDPTDPVEHR